MAVAMPARWYICADAVSCQALRRRGGWTMSGYLTTLAGKHLPVHDGFVIGRVAGCDLVIDDSKASRRHARLVVEAGVAEVEDLGSSNGTRLNDKPVTRRVLRDGDRIQIGATVLVYREGEAPGAAAATAAPTPARAAFEDDDDLLGDAAPTAASPPAPKPAAVAPPAAEPPASPFADDDDDLLGGAPSAAAAPRAVPPPARPTPPVPPAPPAAKPPAAKPPASVVEFADEVVEVRKPAAAPAAKPAAAAPSGAAPSTSGRILQFHKQAGGGGVLGDDLGQVGGGMRALFVLGALALGAGIVWLTIRLVA
jgi:predicted component of type VI protein secretion system